jgi:hypothetical protein
MIELIILTISFIVIFIIFVIKKFYNKNIEIFNDNIEHKNIEIVVSRYNETLEWTTYDLFNEYNYIVYNKGNNDIFEKKNVSKIVNLNNVGMCDHTYLYHIINNYDNLADITIFFPGSLDNPIKKYKANIILNLIKKYNKAVFSAFFYNDGVKNSLYNFYLDKYFIEDEKNRKLNNSGELIKSNIRPFGKWYEEMFNRNSHYISYKGIFSISKKDILKYPVEYYKKFLTQLEIGNNLEVSHYMERSWVTLFEPLINTNISINYNSTDIDTYLEYK